jgi:formylglycine-generating enzyme required for sulfatase activity
MSPATVSDFALDKYMVTVGRFRQFVAAWNNGSGYVPPTGAGKHTYLNGGLGLVDSAADAGVVYETGWLASDDANIAPTDANLACAAGADTWTSAAGTQENLPINCVNWWEAYAFCIWDGGFLPSAAEWEYAAAGGGQQREYPWGSTTPGTACPGTGCEYAIYGCNYPSGPGDVVGCGLSSIAPVGTATLGAGFWGQLDLAGELTEWSLDWSAAFVDPCSDCAYLTSTTTGRVRQKTNFAGPVTFLVPTEQAGINPTFRRPGSGFRCARTP